MGVTQLSGHLPLNELMKLLSGMSSRIGIYISGQTTQLESLQFILQFQQWDSYPISCTNLPV